MSGLEIITFGCRLNAFESEVMRQHASAALDGTIIVNTCAVTGEATRQARQAIRRARRENPSARIIVTGCAAQLDPDSFAAMPEVDRVLGNAEKLDPEALAGETRVAVADIMTVRETAAHLLDGDALSSFGERTRAFVQVQQGCDHRCTFCIIPFARGPSRSVPMGAVVQQVRRLVEAGYAEVVLTGVDISSYGRDLPGGPSLGDLVRRLLEAVPDLKRLRLSSLDPAVMDEALFAALAEEERLMPHVHLSVQALDDMVLKRMKRRHSRAGALAFMARARAARPDVAFGADLIAGFPTETDAMFENTLAGVDEAGLTYLHVFPYSARADTPGARMPQVPAPIRKARATRLRAAGDRALARFLAAQVGREADVLVESEGRGHSAHYAPVRLAFAAPGGALVRARIAEAAGSYLVGTRAA